ncbi:hypothetical protein SKAU_G00418050 [Synaphobranchus kaupii]|uniref:Gypsy retrotransposon integrase-like protein 1 n=1 Tax=Synaphobranchus kaupii TaxID=118154 RepID=A0A9Q1IAW0_SYNKA|nr:hypothetical protein SKAU_G00418050 [Synaphobranchus kaupii]
MGQLRAPRWAGVQKVASSRMREPPPAAPGALCPHVLQIVHGSLGAGHYGNAQTLHCLRGRFYWPGCRRDVELHVYCCDSCTAQRGLTQCSHAPLQQYLVGAPMERVGVDILEPFPVTDSGNRYFTWPEAYAVPDQSANTTAERLVEEMFARFGAPAKLHSDQGRNFEAQVFGEVCRRLGVVHDYTRRAQANSGVRQKRAYDTRCWGQAFLPGDKIWVYCPERKKGVSPKLRSHWQGPGEVVAQLSEVVYRVRMPGWSRVVVLHRDRLSPYRPLAPPAAGEGG